MVPLHAGLGRRRVSRPGRARPSASSTRCRCRSRRASSGCSGAMSRRTRRPTSTFCAAISSVTTRSSGASARDLYLRCVEDDPCYAPAWARLGRIHHVMAKYLTPEPERPGTGRSGVPPCARAQSRSADRAQVLRAVRSRSRPRARCDGAADRARAGSADPELLAGSVSPCRYCGLLEASVAAHARARRSNRRFAPASRIPGSCRADMRASRPAGSTTIPTSCAVARGARTRQEAIAGLAGAGRR